MDLYRTGLVFGYFYIILIECVSCTCVPGWCSLYSSPEVCTIPTTTLTCLNSDTRCSGNGQCYTIANETHCVCNSQTVGSHCQHQLSRYFTPNCSLGNVCLNGASCINKSLTEFECVCPPGFNGTLCEKETLELTFKDGVCANGGTSYVYGDVMRCLCQCEYTGLFCQYKIVSPCEHISCPDSETCFEFQGIVKCCNKYDYSGGSCHVVAVGKSNSLYLISTVNRDSLNTVTEHTSTATVVSPKQEDKSQSSYRTITYIILLSVCIVVIILFTCQRYIRLKMSKFCTINRAHDVERSTVSTENLDETPMQDRQIVNSQNMTMGLESRIDQPTLLNISARQLSRLGTRHGESTASTSSMQPVNHDRLPYSIFQNRFLPPNHRFPLHSVALQLPESHDKPPTYENVCGSPPRYQDVIKNEEHRNINRNTL